MACPNTKAAAGALEDEVELPNMPPPAEVAGVTGRQVDHAQKSSLVGMGSLGSHSVQPGVELPFGVRPSAGF